MRPYGGGPYMERILGGGPPRMSDAEGGAGIGGIGKPGPVCTPIDLFWGGWVFFVAAAVEVVVVVVVVDSDLTAGRGVADVLWSPSFAVLVWCWCSVSVSAAVM